MFASMRPELRKFGYLCDIHGTENYFQIQTKQCLFASISKSVYYAFDCWERDPEERLSYNER